MLMWKIPFKKTKQPSLKYNYKSLHPFDKRKQTAEKNLRDNSKVPVIIETDHISNLPELPSKCFRIPREVTVAKFMIILRNRLLKINSKQGIIFYVNSYIVPSPSKTIGELYDKFKDTDLLLYCKIVSQDTYG
jgi:hypothetical protein